MLERLHGAPPDCGLGGHARRVVEEQFAGNKRVAPMPVKLKWSFASLFALRRMKNMMSVTGKLKFSFAVMLLPVTCWRWAWCCTMSCSDEFAVSASRSAESRCT